MWHCDNPPTITYLLDECAGWQPPLICGRQGEPGDHARHAAPEHPRDDPGRGGARPGDGHGDGHYLGAAQSLCGLTLALEIAIKNPSFKNDLGIFAHNYWSLPRTRWGCRWSSKSRPGWAPQSSRTCTAGPGATCNIKCSKIYCVVMIKIFLSYGEEGAENNTPVLVVQKVLLFMGCWEFDQRLQITLYK